MIPTESESLLIKANRCCWSCFNWKIKLRKREKSVLRGFVWPLTWKGQVGLMRRRDWSWLDESSTWLILEGSSLKLIFKTHFPSLCHVSCLKDKSTWSCVSKTWCTWIHRHGQEVLEQNLLEVLLRCHTDENDMNNRRQMTTKRLEETMKIRRFKKTSTKSQRMTSKTPQNTELPDRGKELLISGFRMKNLQTFLSLPPIRALKFTTDHQFCFLASETSELFSLYFCVWWSVVLLCFHLLSHENRLDAKERPHGHRRDDRSSFLCRTRGDTDSSRLYRDDRQNKHLWFRLVLCSSAAGFDKYLTRY